MPTLLIALSFADSSALIDTAIPAGGFASLSERQVPARLECARVELGERVALGEPYPVHVRSDCPFSVEVREQGCEEEDLGEDWEGCARVEVAPGGGAMEGSSLPAGEEGELVLEWFEVAAPETVATATWRTWWQVGGSGDDYADSGLGSGLGSDLGSGRGDSELADGECGCGTRARPGFGMVVGLLAMGGLLLSRRR